MIYIVITLLVILLISHFYYIYKVEDMGEEALAFFGIIMFIFKTAVLIVVIDTAVSSSEEKYVKCMQTLPQEKIQYCDRYLEK